MTPLLIAITLVAAGAALLAARATVLRQEGTPAHGAMAFDAGDIARFAGQPRRARAARPKSAQAPAPEPVNSEPEAAAVTPEAAPVRKKSPALMSPSDLMGAAPVKAKRAAGSAPAPAPAPAAAPPAAKEAAPAADERTSVATSTEGTRPSDDEIVPASPEPEPQLSAAQRERLERLMSAVKAEFSTLLVAEKQKRELEAQVQD